MKILVLGLCDHVSRNRCGMDSRRRFDRYLGDILPVGAYSWINLIADDLPPGWRIPIPILRDWSDKILDRIPEDTDAVIGLGYLVNRWALAAIASRSIPFLSLPHPSGRSRVWNDPVELERHRTRLKRFLLETKKLLDERSDRNEKK